MTESKRRASEIVKRVLLTGGAYGLGLAAGSVVSQILFSVISPDAYGFLGEGARLLIGLLIVVVVLWIGGAIAGFLGGWTLPMVGRPGGKYGYARKSMMRFGVVYGTFLFLVVFVLSLLTMADAAAMPARPFAYVYAIVGAIFGALFGLLLGVSTVGWRRTGWVVLAGLIGFTLGGAGLGVGVWAYLGSTPAGGVDKGIFWYLLLGQLAFGFLGGAGIGGAYQYLAGREWVEKERPPRSHRANVVRHVLIALAIVLGIYVIRPVLNGVIAIVTPTQAKYSEVIELDTDGTHWMEGSNPLAAEAVTGPLDLVASPAGVVAIAWSGADGDSLDAMLAVGQLDPDHGAVWDEVVNVSQSPEDSTSPRIASGPDGALHVAWLETESGSVIVHYAACEGGVCSEPVPLSDPSLTCGTGDTAKPTDSSPTLDIASGADGAGLAVWRDETGGLQFATLPSRDTTIGRDRGCVPLPADLPVGSVALASGPGSGYSLAFDEGTGSDGNVWLTMFVDNRWEESPLRVGAGTMPGIWVGGGASAHIVWCGPGIGVEYWRDGQTEAVAGVPCGSSPAIGRDEDGRFHAVWYSSVVENVIGEPWSRDVIYESIQTAAGWDAPFIVTRVEGPAGYAMENDPGGVLHLTWVAGAGAAANVQYGSQSEYKCDPAVLSGVEEIMYRIAVDGGYRPGDDVIPFCENRYEMMVFTPNADPAFSDRPPTKNGAYDDYVELAKMAEYEVLFATMAYKDAVNHDSPGAVFADGVAELYEQLKANPDRYPRGLLVRIMLGNSPPIDTLEPNSQLWMVLKDLQEAGLEKMTDPEVGWRLEVANYAGAWPHSHVKTMVIDGKMVVASGFNHEYKPLSKDHASGKGLGDADTGIVFTGPVAQHSRRIYDEIWEGAIQRHCDDLTVDLNLMRFTCEDSRGVSSHVPEVMRYYRTDDDAVVFSMFRNKVYDESDQQITDSFASATESIEVAQAMFSMPLICNLNHFFEVCSFDQALPYMESLMQAAENGAHVRILLMPYPIQSVENVIAMKTLNKEAQARGLEDRMELRFFDDFLHSKSALIDGEFLIVGSQNLHHSAFGAGTGLAEYNLGTSDPAAIEQYKRMFEYYWSRGTPTTSGEE